MKLIFETVIMQFTPAQIALRPDLILETIQERINAGWAVHYVLPSPFGGIVTYVRSENETVIERRLN